MWLMSSQENSAITVLYSINLVVFVCGLLMPTLTWALNCLMAVA